MKVQWFKLNPVNGIVDTVSEMDAKAYISLSDNQKHTDTINISGVPIKCRRDIYLINSITTKEEIDRVISEYNNKNEYWMKILETTKLYYISNFGRVKVVYKSGKQKILRQYFKSGRAKLMVKLPVGGKKYKEFHVHQLVAKAFVRNPNKFECVYHKDFDIHNNKSSNLEWIDRQNLGKLTGGLTNSIPVLKIDKNTKEVLDAYESMAEAGRQNYLHRETIRLCVCGELKTAGDFIWVVDKDYKKNKNKLRGI